VFYAFDLLHLNGTALMHEPLTDRQATLAETIADSGLLLSSSLPGSPADILKGVKALGLEGIVAKKKSAPYVPGERSLDWQKLKLEKQQEFVIGGYRPADRSVDALIVGYYQDDELRFAGKVRAGFVPHTRRELFAKLARIQTQDCPFVDLPTTGGSRWGGGISAEDMRVRGTRACCVSLRWVRNCRFCRVHRHSAKRRRSEALHVRDRACGAAAGISSFEHLGWVCRFDVRSGPGYIVENYSQLAEYASTLFDTGTSPAGCISPRYFLGCRHARADCVATAGLHRC
jgi:hypothetical protein